MLVRMRRQDGMAFSHYQSLFLPVATTNHSLTKQPYELISLDGWKVAPRRRAGGLIFSLEGIGREVRRTAGRHRPCSPRNFQNNALLLTLDHTPYGNPAIHVFVQLAVAPLSLVSNM